MKTAILIVTLILLGGCENYYRVQDQATQQRIAEEQAEVDRIAAQDSAIARQETATIDRNVTVCIARANAAFPGAADDNPVTLQERARLIKWAKFDDACFEEKGGKLGPYNYPSMDDMKVCDRESRSDMPTATTTQRNVYIDDCLEAKGFKLPGHS